MHYTTKIKSVETIIRVQAKIHANRRFSAEIGWAVAFEAAREHIQPLCAANRSRPLAAGGNSDSPANRLLEKPFANKLAANREEKPRVADH